MVLLGCTLNFLNHPFHVDLMPVEMGTYDVIIGMDWLTKYQAIIDCAKKIVRIPFGSEILIFHGDGSRNKRGTRLNIISCTKAQKYVLQGCHAFHLPGPSGISHRYSNCAAPVARDTYRLAQSEMKELADPLQELQTKDLSRLVRLLGELRPFRQEGKIDVTVVHSFRELNKLTGEEPLSTTRELMTYFDQLHGSSVYSKIEPKVWLSQIDRFEKKDISKDAFRTRFGHYEFSSHAVCKQEHEEHLKIILELLKKEELYAKFSKCEFWLPKVQFLEAMRNRKVGTSYGWNICLNGRSCLLVMAILRTVIMHEVHISNKCLTGPKVKADIRDQSGLCTTRISSMEVGTISRMVFVTKFLEFGIGWVKHLQLGRVFSTINSHQASINAAPFEALYGRKLSFACLWGLSYADLKRKRWSLVGDNSDAQGCGDVAYKLELLRICRGTNRDQDSEVKRLKRRRIPLVRFRWDPNRGGLRHELPRHVLGADQLLVILCYRYQESGIGYWILSMTINGAGVSPAQLLYGSG
ncbi:putative reverse transcriptase domain-containing protein [Tanacetum coccineum]|uniref:Reverse transcriptase domain-containing protein n=1 Tax=Tanacetum coccineum TaxID=301880 RepID=A0ABQ5EFN6_9ASTR